MEFLNLSLFELGALFAVLGGLITAVYLLDRPRVKVKVAQLRLWQAAQLPPSQQRRRRIEQPWSLLLQLLALLLLLLAAAQVRWTAAQYAPRNHVLVLDGSAASAAPLRGNAGRTVLAESQRKALEWLNGLPAQDRVSVVEAGTLLTPRTAFEVSRREARKAIGQVRAGTGSVRLGEAFRFAAGIQRQAGGVAGEIVYAGPARLASGEETVGEAPGNLRLLVSEPALNNVGIRRAGVRRSLEDPATWNVLVTLRNYAAAARLVRLGMYYGGAPVASTNLTLAGGAEQTLTLAHRTRAAGMLEVRLLGEDDIALDDRVQLELPEMPVIAARVYTNEPEAWRPLLAVNPLVEAEYLRAEDYRGEDAGAGLLILDNVAGAPPEKTPALVVTRGGDTAVVRSWSAEHAIANGLRSRDFRLGGAKLLTPGRGETVVLEAEGGALVTARPGLVRMGFHPARTAMRQEVTAPLLMANVLRYLAPGSYRQWESVAASPGSLQAPVGELEAKDLQVLTGEGRALPFRIEGGFLRTFLPEPGTVRVVADAKETVYSLTLPDLEDRGWEAPKSVAAGLPAAVPDSPAPAELWRWLAVAGALAMVGEWWLYSRRWRWWKLAALAAIVAALFGPSMTLFETKLAVTVLADTSQSLTPGDLEQLMERVSGVQRARGRHVVRVLPFARGLRGVTPEEAAGGLKVTAGAAGMATNLEAALRDAIATTPAGLVPRMVLVSDGMETEGDVFRALWQAQQMQAPVDTFALAGRPKPQLVMEAVRVPGQAFAGEKFSVEMEVRAPRAATADVELQGEGKRIGAGKVELKAGVNRLNLTASLNASGVVQLAGIVRAGEMGEARFDQALRLRQPKMLYVSQDPAGTEANFVGAVKAYQFELDRREELPRDLSGYDVVVLNNQDLVGYAPEAKAAIEDYVKRGGGLLTLGGERNQYVEKKPGVPEDALERTLPAKLAPPKSPEGTCVVLIIDKSSSMEGRKMELARSAAIGVVENLRPFDLIGVLIFDNSHQWAVPIRKAEDKVLIKRLIAGITPDGGTQIAPALVESYKKILPVKATFRHIVLLTDGISEEGDSIGLAREAAQHRVTISTVGLGQDVNKGYLEKVAQFAKGKSYFINDPNLLEQILLRDVMEFTGSTAVEKPTQPIVVRAAEVLEGTGVNAAPVLKGYVKYEAKPSADLLLTVPGEKGDLQDPLLVRWQYGLGRVTVFTSDAKSRWAENWVNWPGYDRFWGNVLRDLLPHAVSDESSVGFDAATGELEVTYRLDPRAKQTPPPLFAFGPNGFQKSARVQKVAAGVYRGRIAVGSQTGLFRVRPAEVTREFPELGYYRPEAELTRYGNNEALLKQVAEFSGGRFNPRYEDVFRGGGRQIETVLALWPLLLGLAILLSLAELVLRKDVLAYWRRRRTMVSM